MCCHLTHRNAHTMTHIYGNGIEKNYYDKCLFFSVSICASWTSVWWVSHKASIQKSGNRLWQTSEMSAMEACEVDAMFTVPSQVSRWQHPWFGHQSALYQSASETPLACPPPTTKCVHILHNMHIVSFKVQDSNYGDVVILENMECDDI